MEHPLKDVLQLIRDIKLKKLDSSFNIAVKTLDLFKKIISTEEWQHAEELMKIIRNQGHIMSSALPQESVMANLTRRLLKIIREEFEILQVKVHPLGDESQMTLSLHKLVTQTSEYGTSVDYAKPHNELKEAILDHLQELENELENGNESICAQAEHHIHSSEVILTLGHSRSVEQFLRSAIKMRQSLTIIVAECAPACRGHNLATNLASDKVEIIIIPDSTIFAMMSRVNKVIIGAHTVLANGGLKATCGAHTVALAAKHYSVPVIVLTSMYKLSPVHLCSYEQEAFNSLNCSESILPYNTLAAKTTKCYSPMFDYVPPELVTLFISNTGGYAPSYVYRLLTELYHPDDYEI